MRTSADIFTAPDTLPIGIKRTQRHKEVHVGARKKLAVEGAPVQAWRRLLKRAGSGADFGVVCWATTGRAGEDVVRRSAHMTLAAAAAAF